MATAEELLAEGSAVVVPRHLASTTFNALVLYLDGRVRADGGALTPDTRAFLHALHRAASGATAAPTSSEGSLVANSEILGAHEVADILGCSRRWATALLGSGRLRSRQLGGRTWVTTRGDLDAYRYGREEAPDGEAASEDREGRGSAAGRGSEGAAGPS